MAVVALSVLLCAPASGAVVTSAGAAAAPSASAAGPGLTPVALTPDAGQPTGARRAVGFRPVRSATVSAGPRRAAAGTWQWRGWRTDGFSQVGATWRGRDPVLQMRSRGAGDAWGAWQELEVIHDVPSGGEGDPGLRGADLAWVGEARDLQVRVRGAGYRDLEVVLIDPGATPSDARPVPEASGGARQARPSRAPKPRIFGRNTWGANESWRENPRYTETLQAVHVHHTVNTNSYARSDVAPLIRGIYRYHVKSLGWSDVGYNFLVDRFGRAWVGRAGGARYHVRGAHTLGFNDNGAGVAVIGNFEEGPAPRAARWMVAKIAAWKLDMEGLNPSKWRRIWSHGSDLYRSGSRPKLPRVAGHRDTNQTACPGYDLYRHLGGIRGAAQKRVNNFS